MQPSELCFDYKEQPARRFFSFRVFLILLFTTLLVMGMTQLDMPYVIQTPGPSVNVLGADNDGREIIHIEDAEVYPTSGQLRMTSVSVIGGEGAKITPLMLLRAYLSEGNSIVPEANINPSGKTKSEQSKAAKLQMESSQQVAEVMALVTLGYTVPAKYYVLGVDNSTSAKGKFVGDEEIISIQTASGEPVMINTINSLFDFLQNTPPKTPVKLRVRQGDEESVIDLVTTKPVNQRTGEETTDVPGSRLGIIVVPEYKLPVQVDINLAGIGGPSAGAMFALGIIDKLTPGELTGGKRIAGTGALGFDGRVKPISGIEQKMYGALRDGAQWFLAPWDNCEEVQGNVPAGLEVVAVRTLVEAKESVEKIAAGDVTSLRRCPVNHG